MRCTECETVGVEEPRHCECCGRPLNGAASPAGETPAVEVDCGWASLDDVPAYEALPTEAFSQPAHADTDDAFTTLAPEPTASCPPSDQLMGSDLDPLRGDRVPSGESTSDPASAQGPGEPAPGEVPAPAPGSHEYLQLQGGFTTLDPAPMTDTVALHGVVVTDQATTSRAAAARADEMTSSLLADHAVRDLNPEDDGQAPPPWWAARTPSSTAAADAAPPDGESAEPTVTPAPIAPEPTVAAAPASPLPAPRTADERPRQPRSSLPRHVAHRGSPAAAPRALPRPTRRPSRFLAHAAVALVAVSVAGLLGAPTLKQWSHGLASNTTTARPPALPEATVAPHADAVAPAVADVALPEPAKRAPWRDTPTGASETATGTRPATAATAAARAAKAPRRFTLAVPARPAEVPARHETVEPIAAAPLAAASPAVSVAPTVVASPPVVAPTTALEATKVDVKPAVVKRVNAHTARAASTAPEMVVLRVLVSSSGSPATVHVLRGSKADPTSDGAAVDAVKQWAFSPALKNGRPVDCWFNVAVPVEGTAQ